ncbi:capping protein inhibiting regulator of actin dynamics isoform X1 [Electrophorus electricus]|uniref:capping protein inhibiting regulator of actin dynamics isoform X1 n=2 Tax=Electrophorus electricus TaxID=8005 RepID=UPI0015D03C1C|nr:capping protein inhibiting regulator of actin dynamics isoform X1 [Electrophorus electricus]XP_026880226.2 capping protein inhibiting regulator of actin dynamics isoform X1 [Electrophorus electricus]
MFPKVFLWWWAALSSRAADLDRRRQGKFQPFQRLFGRRRRRETERGFEEAELKPRRATADVCNGEGPGHEETNQDLRELNPLGSRAFSHESVFIPEDSGEKPCAEQTMSQENVSDKVRNLQRQIGLNIKFGQKPPSLRKSEGDEGSSDEEEVPRSPMQVLAQVESEPRDAETTEKLSPATHDVTQHRPPLKSPRTKRPPPPGTIESINLDAVPQSVPRLDNTAAKHKLAVKPKHQRVSRKHRRFTQELHEMDILAVLQEGTDVQKFAEESGVCREDYARSHTRDDHEPPEKSKKQRLQEEELECLELQRKLDQEEHRRREEEKRAEEMRLEERRRLMAQEEERLQKEEERRKKEEERKRREEEQQLREEEERKRHKEEESKKREQEEKRRLQEFEAECLHSEEKKRKREAEEERRKQEEAEKRRLWELEEKWRREEEARLCEQRRRQQEEEEAQKKRLAEEKKRKEEEDRKKNQEEERASEEQTRASDLEWKRKAEELRWREMEEGQRPFTFKVTSGEKQILFQKVNLSPVTPMPGQQDDTTAEPREGTTGGPDSPALSSSLYVPHTAILVTGAQLCGTAVNLDQIKDTACKSLLGLSEDKKAMDIPLLKCKTSPDSKFGKTKSLHEASLSADQSSAAVLAEWASIRSKIFKGAEDGKYQEYSDENYKQAQGQTTSEDKSLPPFSHTSLRKTMSASAKFSITPARKKFPDSNRNSEVFGQDDRQGGKVESPSTDSAPRLPVLSIATNKAQNKGLKAIRISDSSEECKFAKDLPSFLVPSMSPGSPKSQKLETASLSQVESEVLYTNDDGGQRDQSSDERPSPFGIKLRRTNYSLRFHSEQSTEKRKKRYSAGDSFDGVPVPLTSTDQDPDTSVFSEKTSPISPLQDSSGVKLQSVSSAESRSKTGRNSLSSVCNESEKPILKPPLYQKPATSPKPSEGATPPPSPLPKPGRRTSGDQRTGGPDLASGEECGEQKEVPSESVQSQRNSQGDDEPKEKKSFFPSISIPWREKTDRRTELIRREKPSLQSRHSLDSSRAQEKEAGPLWITLALQKQKGFREQQQSREERRIQREAKLAEKQAREKETMGLISPMEGKGNSSLPKPHTPEENKRPDSLFVRFERRENLKKANTLPNSVTVEIADSTPSPPAAKDITKRFPPGDNAQVSTEPAWLALAKRKAKAWSDCPQIIK